MVQLIFVDVDFSQLSEQKHSCEQGRAVNPRTPEHSGVEAGAIMTTAECRELGSCPLLN